MNLDYRGGHTAYAAPDVVPKAETALRITKVDLIFLFLGSQLLHILLN